MADTFYMQVWCKIDGSQYGEAEKIYIQNIFKENIKIKWNCCIEALLFIQRTTAIELIFACNYKALDACLMI